MGEELTGEISLEKPWGWGYGPPGTGQGVTRGKPSWEVAFVHPTILLRWSPLGAKNLPVQVGRVKEG